MKNEKPWQGDYASLLIMLFPGENICSMTLISSSSSSPDNSPDSKKLGGTAFPACAKNTLLSRVI
jgi:hypothetical protein